MSLGISKSEPSLTLVPAKLDFATTKTQMTLASLVAVVTTFALYWAILSNGLLKEDIAILHLVSQTPGSNFSPVGWMSFFLDFRLWHHNLTGYYACNLLIYGLCAVLVGQIASQIAYIGGNRLNGPAAMWSALLFALFPLNYHAVLSLSSRESLLGGVLYLSCIFFFLRFRIVRDRSCFSLSLLAFALALITNTQTVGLIPVVICADLLLFRSSKQPVQQRALTLSAYPMVLCAALTLVIALPLNSPLLKLKDDFCAWSTLSALQSAREYFSYPSPIWLGHPSLAFVLAGLLGTALLFTLWRSLSKTISFSGIAFLFLWLTMSLLLPPAQGKAFANSFMLLSAMPFCMLLSLACLPAVDSIGRNDARRTTIAGTILLVALSSVFALWSIASQQSLVQEARQLRSLQKNLLEKLAQVPGQKTILLLSNPSGIDQNEVDLLVTYPFSPSRTNDRLQMFCLSKRPKVPAILAQSLKGKMTDPTLSATLYWDDRNQCFADWHPSEGNNYLLQNFSINTMKDCTITPNDESSRKVCVAEKESVTIHPCDHAITIWLPPQNLNPLLAEVADLNLEMRSLTGCAACTLNKVKFVWQGEALGGTTEQVGEAAITQPRFGTFLVWLSRYKNWATCKKINRIGLQFAPGPYIATLKGMELVPYKTRAPQLLLQDNNQLTALGGQSQLSMKQTKAAVVIYDVSPIRRAAGIKVIVLPAESDFSPESEDDIYVPYTSAGDQPQFSFDSDGVQGQVTIPNIFDKPGKYYLRAMTISDDGALIGLPSEALLIKVAE